MLSRYVLDLSRRGLCVHIWSRQLTPGVEDETSVFHQYRPVDLQHQWINIYETKLQQHFLGSPGFIGIAVFTYNPLPDFSCTMQRFISRLY